MHRAWLLLAHPASQLPPWLHSVYRCSGEQQRRMSVRRDTRMPLRHSTAGATSESRPSRNRTMAYSHTPYPQSVTAPPPQKKIWATEPRNLLHTYTHQPIVLTKQPTIKPTPDRLSPTKPPTNQRPQTRHTPTQHRTPRRSSEPNMHAASARACTSPHLSQRPVAVPLPDSYSERCREIRLLAAIREKKAPQPVLSRARAPPPGSPVAGRLTPGPL